MFSWCEWGISLLSLFQKWSACELAWELLHFHYKVIREGRISTWTTSCFIIFNMTLAAFSGTSAEYEEGENTAGKSSASWTKIFNVVDELSPLFGPPS